MDGKVKIGTCWLDGCSGCHMSLLDMDEGIVAVLRKADIVFGPLVDAQEWPEETHTAQTWLRSARSSSSTILRYDWSCADVVSIARPSCTGVVQAGSSRATPATGSWAIGCRA